MLLLLEVVLSLILVQAIEMLVRCVRKGGETQRL
jgi:hypothetical protein